MSKISVTKITMSHVPASPQHPDLYPGESSTSSSGYNPVYRYKPYETRCYTHHNILAIGSMIHEQIMEELAEEKKRSIEIMKSVILSQAEQQTKLAVQKATENSNAEKEYLVVEAKKQTEFGIQDAINKTKKEMEVYLESELKKAHEEAEQKRAQEIQKIKEKCNQEKMAAIEQVKQKQKKRAYSAQMYMKKMLTQQHKKALKIAAKKHLKRMQQLKEEKDLEIDLVVAVAQREEQGKAQEVMQEQEMNHQAELKAMEVHLTGAQDIQKSTKVQLASVVASKTELEEEIKETRDAFQKYITLTFPQLGPGQADFILPYRKKIQEALNKQDIIEAPCERQI